MLGFRVLLDDESIQLVEASEYEVGDEGDLVMKADNEVVTVVSPGRWISVEEFGTRLVDEWPPPTLANVLDSLAHVLVVKYGHVVWSRGTVATYASEVFNEVDSLAGGVLVMHQINPKSTVHGDLQVIADVRRRTAEAFGCRVPPGRLVPSLRITALHCPRCGDLLHDEPKGHRCPTGDMRVGPDLLEALHEYRRTPPPSRVDTESLANWDDTWFCPDDGFRLNSSPGQPPNCLSCQRVLPADLLHQLIESDAHE